MIRVLLADDHRLVRAGVRALVEGLGGYQVVAEADDGRAAVRLARDLLPDLGIVDISMPELNGFDAIARLRRAGPAMRLLVLSMHNSAPYAQMAFDAGANGYVVKDAAVAELATALATLMHGGRYLSPAISLAVKQRARQSVLTSRQREVLQLIAEGRSTREIAERLFISVKTVETHRAQLMERLGIADVASLTRHAMEIGLVAPPPGRAGINTD